MGWGLGFSNDLRPYTSGVAEIFTDFAKVKGTTRNRVHKAVSRLYLNANNVLTGSGQPFNLLHYSGIRQELPFAESFSVFSAVMPKGIKDEMLLKLRLVGWRPTPSGGVFVPDKCSEEHREHLMEMLDSVITLYAPERNRIVLTDSNEEYRENLLRTIERKGIFTSHRRF